MKRLLLGSIIYFVVFHVLAADLFQWHSHSKETSVTNASKLTGVEASFLNGRTFEFNKKNFKQLNTGDSFNVNLPNKTSIQADIFQIKHTESTSQYFAYLNTEQAPLPVVITIGPTQFFMRIITNDETYVAHGNHTTGSLIEESTLSLKSDNLLNDVKQPPPHKGEHNSKDAKNTNSTLLNLKTNDSATNSEDIATVKVLFVHGLTQTQINDNYSGDIDTQIHHIIAITNQIYLDSGVNIRIEPTSILAVDYPIENDADTALDDITFARHSAFNDIEDIRFQQGADMVVLLRMFVEGDDACGLAWGNSSITSAVDFMYSHTSIDCADYVNAHELGHNMGLAHSQAQGDTGYTYPYARGYRLEDQSNGFSTVMAYSVTNAPKVYKFSNPDILCTEIACGIDSTDTNNGADARLALNQVRFQLAELFDDQANAVLINSVLNEVTDNNLKQCIQQTAENLNIQYVGQLHELYCNQINISTLQGLNSFTSLTRLEINGNVLSNFNGIADLNKLTRLSANNNSISDFSVLSKLSGLTQLSLTNTGLQLLTDLTSLTNLSLLWISDNEVSDLSPLSSVVNLNSLYAANNKIQNISPLASLSKLQTIELSGNQLTSISTIAQLPVLSNLYVDRNNLTSLSELAGLSTLKHLSANFNFISSFEGLEELSKLNYLSISNNQLGALPIHAVLPNLEVLLLSNNNINIVNDMSSFTKLRVFDLSNNPVIVFSQFANMNQLKELNLNNTQLTTLTFLSKFTKLEFLDIGLTSISDISVLDKLLYLMSINLTDTQVEDISPIFSLHNSWSEIILSQATQIYCWQLDYVAKYIITETYNQPTTCDASQDSLDFDQDTITNRLELSTNTNPVFHNTQTGQISFQVDNMTLHEEDESINLKIVRKSGDFGQISVDVATEDITASANNDYEPIDQNITFASGEHVKYIKLNLVQDDTADFGKQFKIKLMSESQAVIGTFDEVTITINDEDSGIFSWQTPTLIVSENSESFVVNIQRTGTTTGQAQVDVSAINGTAVVDLDYRFTPKTLVFNDGEMIKGINIDLINDEQAETNESFYLALNNAINASINEQKKLTIIEVTDDDTPPAGVLSFEQSSMTVSESDSRVTINIFRDNGSFGEISFVIEFTDETAVNGSDYIASNETYTMVNGETQKSIAFTVNDDTAVESVERFSIQLLSENPDLLGTVTEITVSINDNDTSVTPTNNTSNSGGGGGSMAWILLFLLIPLFTFKQRKL